MLVTFLTRPKMTFVPKGWGFEKWICNNEKYCGKLLYFVKDKKCSLHYHKLKDEVFYVQSGKIKVLWSDDLERIEELAKLNISVGRPLNETILEKGDNFHVPPGRVHQMLALEDTELFEFSTQHFDSDSFKILVGD